MKSDSEDEDEEDEGESTSSSDEGEDDDESSDSEDEEDEDSQSEDDESSDSEGDSSDEDDGDEDDGVELTLADIQPIFTKSCGCHDGVAKESPAAGLDLADGVSYDAIVEVENKAGLVFVVPGDPEESYLYRKMEDTHLEMEGGAGKVMPMAGKLEDAVLEKVKQWIEDGAVEK